MFRTVYTILLKLLMPLFTLQTVRPVVLCGETTSKDAPFLLRFVVAFTLQVVQFAVIGIGRHIPVIQLLSEVHMQPCDTMAKRPFTSTHLMSLCYTKRRPSHNLIHTVDHIFSCCSEKFICACSLLSAHAHSYKIRLEILNIS